MALNDPLSDSYLANPALDVRTSLFLAPEQARNVVETLLNVVETHASNERVALADYANLRDMGDPIIQLVMQIILEDEERHHGLLKRIAASLSDALSWTHSPEALPSGAIPVGVPTKEMLARAKELVKEEQTGAKHLRRIAGEERHINNGLDSALLEMMAIDSSKHERLLQYVVQRLEHRA